MGRNINDLPKLGIKTSVPYSVTLTTAGTYYCLCDPSTAPFTKQYFTPNVVTGEITYDFDYEMLLQFIGDTGITVSGACDVTFALILNGVPYLTSPLTFVSSAKTNSMGANAVMSFTKGDVIQVMAKSDTDGIVLGVQSLHVSIGL